MPDPPTSTITSPAGRSGGRFARSNGSSPHPPKPPKPRLKKLRLALVLLGLSILALISTVFGMLMAVASDLPALENRAEYVAARNSVLYAGLPGCKDGDTGSCDEIAQPHRQPEPDPARPGRDLAQHQERRHRHRGQALLRARGRGLPGHRARPLAGHPAPERRPGRLDDHPAVREERALGPGRPLGLPEAARGGARLPPRAQVVEGQGAHAVPEHRVLRERRLRRGVRRPHLLRGRDAPARRHHGQGLRGRRPGGRRREPRRGGAARGDDRVAHALRPGRQPAHARSAGATWCSRACSSSRRSRARSTRRASPLRCPRARTSTRRPWTRASPSSPPG